MSIAEELSSLVVGECIGQGVFRSIHLFKPDNRLVIKIANDATAGWHNVIEYRVYMELQFSDLQRWLAPCIMLSDGGKYLLQKRVMPIAKNHMPSRIPA